MAVNASIIDCKDDKDTMLFRFVILDAPSPSTLPVYVRELQKLRVKDLVRVCGQTYKHDIVEKVGIRVHGFPFDDGAPPPQNVIDSWLNLLEDARQEVRAAGDYPTIAVHCVAGLGRAPILVALALVEYGKMPPLDAIGEVRSKRKGAVNQVQLNWLTRYKPRKTSREKDCCAIM